MLKCHVKTPPTPLKDGTRQKGYTYLLVLFMVAALGLMVAQVGVVWQQEVRREREADLLAQGVEIARALASYKRVGPQQVYPAKLTDLLEDKRFPNPVRHLRRIYRDPLTGNPRWGQVIQAGQIVGIYSLAPGVPIRTNDLPPELGDASAEPQSYADWVFRPVDGPAPGGAEGASPRAGAVRPAGS